MPYILEIRLVRQLQSSSWHQGVGGVKHIVQSPLKVPTHVGELHHKQDEFLVMVLSKLSPVRACKQVSSRKLDLLPQ